MHGKITQGNAIQDGSLFDQWFIGDLKTWVNKRSLNFDKGQIGLRDTDKLEVKWGIYVKGDRRTDWAHSTTKTAVSILVSGSFSFSFRSPDDPSRSSVVSLENEGDYVIWKEDVEHTWKASEDSVVITIKW